MPPLTSISMMLLRLLLPSVLLSLSLADPIVHIEYGDVIGFDHGDTEIFLGIPFAAPPIGDLRFRKPVAPQPWSEPRQATNWSDACVPHSRGAVTWKASEDCLYLNVIAPKRESSSPLAPVLFFIHGGGFEAGDAKMYGYEQFAEMYGKQGIVVVSIQYRIGVLGFFTLNSSDSLAGNYGMFDQVEALRFVHRNIKAFGGDPARITVFGNSAGGCSASMLTLSPLSRDLIAGSIEASGTAHAGWAIDNRVEHHSEELADAVGCWGKRSIEDIEKCMRNVSVNDIYGGVDHICESAFSFNMLKFAPRLDGVFAPKRYEDLAKDAPKIPVLTGINTLESAFFTLMNRGPTIHRSGISKEEMSGFNVDKFERKVRILMNEFLESNETDQAVDDVLHFYLGPDAREKYAEPTKEEIPQLLQQYSHFWGDVYFNLPARYRADERKQIGADSYVYLWEHFNSGIFKDDDPVPAAVHTNEMPYIIGLQKMAKFEWTEEEMKVKERGEQMMVTFIKNGKPSVDGVFWPSYTESSNSSFVRVASPEWKTEQGFWEKHWRFWEEIMGKYSYDFPRFKKRDVAQMQIPTNVEN